MNGTLNANVAIAGWKSSRNSGVFFLGKFDDSIDRSIVGDLLPIHGISKAKFQEKSICM